MMCRVVLLFWRMMVVVLGRKLWYIKAENGPCCILTPKSEQQGRANVVWKETFRAACRCGSLVWHGIPWSQYRPNCGRVAGITSIPRTVDMFLADGFSPRRDQH